MRAFFRWMRQVFKADDQVCHCRGDNAVISKQTTKYATAEEITAFFKEKKLNLEDYKNAHTDLKYTVKEYRSDYESSYKLTAKGDSVGQDV